MDGTCSRRSRLQESPRPTWSVVGETFRFVGTLVGTFFGEGSRPWGRVSVPAGQGVDGPASMSCVREYPRILVGPLE